MIPVNFNATDAETNLEPTTLMSPVAAAEERALSEMKTEKPHVKVRKTIKRKKRKKKISRKKSNIRSTSEAERAKSNKRSTFKEKKKKSGKRKLSTDYSDSVWKIKKTKT